MTGRFELTVRSHESDLIFILRLNDSPEHGAFIYGLFIEGACWDDDEKTLCEQQPKSVLNEFPMIHFVVSHSILVIINQIYTNIFSTSSQL